MISIPSHFMPSAGLAFFSKEKREDNRFPG